MGIGDEFTEGLTNVKNLIGENQAASIGIAALGAAALGAGAVGLLMANQTSSKKRKAKSKRGRKRDRLFKSKQKHEQKYKRKRKYKIYKKKGYIKAKSKRSGKIHYARKTGQPYILLRNGRAKFIKGKRRKK